MQAETTGILIDNPRDFSGVILDNGADKSI
jgi:hypothetical protein